MPSVNCLTALLKSGRSVAQRNGYLGSLSDGSDRRPLDLERLLVTGSDGSGDGAPGRAELLMMKLMV